MRVLRSSGALRYVATTVSDNEEMLAEWAAATEAIAVDRGGRARPEAMEYAAELT